MTMDPHFQMTYENTDVNSESEAGAVAIVERTEAFGDTCLAFRRLPTSSDIPDGAKLYLAPPSAQAIETAAIMRAAEAAGDGYVSKEFLLALIPQDERTQLEELLSKFAEALLIEIKGNYGTAHVSDGPLWHVIVKRAIHAIVTNRLGATK